MSDLIERLKIAINAGSRISEDALAEIERLTGVVSDYWDDKIKSMERIAELESALRDIRDHAIDNGEDCAYLDACAALQQDKPDE